MESANLIRQLVYSLGRIATYTSVGAIAGYAGANLSSTFSTTLPIRIDPAADRRRIVDRPRSYCSRDRKASDDHRPASMYVAAISERLLASTRVHQCLLCRRIHWISALRPCLCVSVSCLLHYEHDRRVAYDVRLWIGDDANFDRYWTCAGLLTLAMRRRVLQLAGYCVLLAGVLSLLRGVEFLSSTTAAQAMNGSSGVGFNGSPSEIPKCPCCRD